MNLTVLSTPLFTQKYLSRILTDKNPEDREDAERKLACMLPSEAVQNEFHLAFNTRIALLAKECGASYFDINDRIAARGPHGRIVEPMRLATVNQPMAFDHHLAPTLKVHRVHIDALQAAFS